MEVPTEARFRTNNSNLSGGKPRPELFKDGLHFNAEAYKLSAKIIRPYLE